MALVNSNAGLRVSFDKVGGTVIFDFDASGTGGATNTQSVLGIVEGSLSFTPPTVERITDYDKGAIIAAPRRGNDLPGAISMRLKVTNDIGADEVYTRMLDDDDSAGKVPIFWLQVDIPDYRGAATGITHTFTKCHFAGPGTHQAGSEHDEIGVDMVCHGTHTRAAY